MDRLELLDRLAVAGPTVLTAVVAQLFYKAFGVGEPPGDAAAMALWRRRFRFMVASEIASVPALVVAAVLIPDMRGWTSTEGAIFGFVLGIVGYGTASAAVSSVFKAWAGHVRRKAEGNG